MLMEPYGAEAGTGSALHWRERSDGHWLATATGGHYEIVGEDGQRWHAWWMPRSATPVDLGSHGSMGGATMAAKRHADQESRMAAEAAEGCSHTHPAGVPSGPCPDPSAHHHPVVAAVQKTETAIVAAEPGEFRAFGTWQEVLAYARTGAPLYYQAPLDYRPVRVQYKVGARTIRITPPGARGRGRLRTSDPFTADSAHLDRFRRPAEAASEARPKAKRPRRKR